MDVNMTDLCEEGGGWGVKELKGVSERGGGEGRGTEHASASHGRRSEFGDEPMLVANEGPDSSKVQVHIELVSMVLSSDSVDDAQEVSREGKEAVSLYSKSIQGRKKNTKLDHLKAKWRKWRHKMAT